MGGTRATWHFTQAWPELLQGDLLSLIGSQGLLPLHHAPRHLQDQPSAERTPSHRPGPPSWPPLSTRTPAPGSLSHLQQSFADLEVDREQNVQLGGTGRELPG